MAISKTYSEGECITYAVGEHTFTTPPIPNKKDILFSEKPIKDQYWQRKLAISDIPAYFYAWNTEVEFDADATEWRGKTLKALSIKDTFRIKEFRDREIRRRKDGVWFMNNGEYTYITGHHYFALTWFSMMAVDNFLDPESKFGMYLQFQRDFFYFYEICKKTTYGRGGMVVKPKKTGVTMLMGAICLNEATLHREKLIRIMSTRQKDANSSCFKYIDFAVQRMPTILTPSIGNLNTSSIIFDMPEKKNSKAAAKLRETNADYYSTQITTVPTANNSFDTLTNYLAWVDEFTKIKTEANPKGLHEVTIDTVMQGMQQKGIIMYTNYTQEENDESFEEGRQIFKDSYLHTVDVKTGMTKSKLICYTMLVQHGIFPDLKDGKMVGINKYGLPIMQDIKTMMDDIIDQIKDNPAKLQGFRRRMPQNEQDPWLEAGGERQMFDVLRLTAQMQQIEIDHDTPEYFNLRFEIPPRKIDEVSTRCTFEGRILYDATTEEDMKKGDFGRFMWYDKQWTPHFFLEKNLNKLVIDDRNGLLRPRLDTPFFISVDPTNYSLKKDVVVGSKNAIQVFILHNNELNGYFGENVTNRRLMVDYLYRHDKPHHVVMDVIMCALYFGAYVLIESNMATIATKMIEMGLGNFVLYVNPETDMLEPYREGRNLKPFKTQSGSVGQYFVSAMNHLKEPEIEGERDEMKFIKSMDVLKQLARIKPEETTKFDAGMCYIFGQWGIDWFYGWRRKEMEKDRMNNDPAGRKLAMGIMRL